MQHWAGGSGSPDVHCRTPECNGEGGPWGAPHRRSVDVGLRRVQYPLKRAETGSCNGDVGRVLVKTCQHEDYDTGILAHVPGTSLPEAFERVANVTMQEIQRARDSSSRRIFRF